MLLDDAERRIEGEQGAVLYEVHFSVVQLLTEHGHDVNEADRLALLLLPRLQARLGSAGLVTRQLEHAPGRRARR